MSEGQRKKPRNWGHVCIGTASNEPLEYGQIGGMIYLPLTRKNCPDCGASQ